MKTFTEAITEAAKYSTKKEKYHALSGLNADGIKLLEESENPFRVFGVKKWDAPEIYNVVDFDFTPFFKLCDFLCNRTLTGNAARSAVTSILSLYTPATAELLERVLRKDLKCGATATTFKDIYPSFSIPEFDLMLCSKIESIKDAQGRLQYPSYDWVFPCQAEVKYDGRRLVSLSDNGTIEYLSRSGKPSSFCEGIFDEELSQLEKYYGCPMAFDGEALSIEGFQATSRLTGKKSNKDTLRLFLFDAIPLNDWKNQQCLQIQSERTQNLHKAIIDLKLTRIIMSDYKVLHNMNEAYSFYNEVIENGAPGQDEGLIIKMLNGLYVFDSKKRSNVWAKWKPVIDVDVTITSFYYGNPNTKNEHRLGGFVVEGKDENGNKIKSKCGGFKVNCKKYKDWFSKFAKDNKIDIESFYNQGISKDEVFRSLVVQRPELFIGQTCTIETQELSLAENSDSYSLRFPQFLCLRDDK